MFHFNFIGTIELAEMVEIIGTLHEIEGVSKVTGVLPTSEYLGFFIVNHEFF